MRCYAFLLSLLVLGGTGCSPVSREELAKQILKTDPEFTSVLDKHREVANRIETYERELALKRSTVERDIAQMRKNLVAATVNVRSKVAEAKKRMDPDRKRLELTLSLAGEELRAKQAQRASLGRSVSQLRKAVTTSNPEWSARERSEQEARIEEMLRDAKRLDQEMAALKEHVKLLKIKLLLIKL